MVMIIYSETLPYGYLLITATLLGCLAKTATQILVKKPSLIRPILFGPLVTVLTASTVIIIIIMIDKSTI